MPKEFRLVPINPFTPRQREIIELKLQGLSYKEMSKKLGISIHTIHNHVLGNGKYASIAQMKSETDRSDLGIFGIIQVATGRRPKASNWLPTLFGDVILEVGSPDTPKLTRESSAGEFIYFIRHAFDRESVNIFLEKKKNRGSYDELFEFVKSPLIDKRLRKQWLYESSPKWGERTVNEAINETLGHGLGNLWGDIAVYRKNGKGNFAGLTSKQVNEIDRKLTIVQNYFDLRFQSIHQTAVENFLSNR